ncbi:M20/M25/M40 family metallo-hydrolase [Porphyromonadaceae bacterium W3.11]|nr:M20/M25/M40 family metallo-hydrolase [Porphyromonadaceae bacterium W3.11]
MKESIMRLWSLLLLVLLVACSTNPDKTLKQAEESINAEDMASHVRMLASDEFQGRKPFTEGEAKAIAYLSEQFQKLGLKAPYEGSYLQEVPMVQISYQPSTSIQLKLPKGNLELDNIQDYIAKTPHIVDEVNILNTEVVFAGYGIVAPEYDWDDYDGIDVKDKMVIVLVNDPGFATQDPQLFNGNAMTYYGRWAYKYEEAARQGAKGIWVVHDTRGAGYPWASLSNTCGSNLYLLDEDNNRDQCALTGWITEEACKKIFDYNGMDYAQVKKTAATRDFKSFSLNTHLNLTIKNDLKYDISHNVVGVIEGKERKDECIVYSAHWDHFGIGPAHDGDSIYNGAADNALAVACMLETAKAFAKAPQPQRSIVFISITAEETGMLGSNYYAHHSLFEPQKTVANLNYELPLPLGRMKDVTITGFGQSELDQYVERLAQDQDRYIAPEPSPENGMYYRSDHFSFAKVGIPSLFIKGWQDSREHGKEWAREQVLHYWETAYHKPADEFDPQTADLSGNVEDAKLFFKIGWQLANEDAFPVWSDKSEFKSIREASMQVK